MHIFANTDTRIINIEGTIIVVTAFADKINKYRVMIDGIDSGYLEDLNGILYPVNGIQIKLNLLDEINKLAKRDHPKLQVAG